MYSTSVYVYTQRQVVILLSGNSARSYVPQFANPLTLHKGCDNQLQFRFLNQQQKPIDITGKEITCRIINYNSSKILLSKALNLQLALTGIATLDLNAADIENIPPQKCYYTLEIPSGAFNYPVFVDQNAGGRGDLNIVNSILPAFVPSSEITIPTNQVFPNTVPNTTASLTYYTSVINTEDNPILSLQTTYSEFSGNVVIEGSCTYDTGWYPILTNTYENTTDTYGYVVKGFHPFIRIKFTSNSGSVTNILSR